MQCFATYNILLFSVCVLFGWLMAGSKLSGYSVLTANHHLLCYWSSKFAWVSRMILWMKIGDGGKREMVPRTGHKIKALTLNMHRARTFGLLLYWPVSSPPTPFALLQMPFNGCCCVAEMTTSPDNFIIESEERKFNSTFSSS